MSEILENVSPPAGSIVGEGLRLAGTSGAATAKRVSLLYLGAAPAAAAPSALVRLGYVNESEAELIRQCIAGDHRAWEAFIRRYQSRVYNVAYHMTQDADRAGDLAQEALIQILKSLSRFRGEASLSTWVHGLTMRVCLHHLRKERRRQADSWEDLAPGRAEPETSYGRPHEEVSREQLQRRVQEAIAALPLKFRSVMVLHGLGGMTYEETAQALNLPVNTVKTRVFRAKARLRQACISISSDWLSCSAMPRASSAMRSISTPTARCWPHPASSTRTPHALRPYSPPNGRSPTLARASTGSK